MGELLKLSQPITKYLIRMKRILLIMILSCFTAVGFAQGTYYWVGGSTSGTLGGTNWSLTPGGTAVSRSNTADILIFDNVTVAFSIGSATIGKLQLQNGADVSFVRNSNTGTSTLTLNNGSGVGLQVSGNSKLRVIDGTGGNFVVALAGGSTGSVDNSEVFVQGAAWSTTNNGAQRITVPTGSTLTFSNSSNCYVNVINQYPFSSTVNSGSKSVIFNSGTSLVYQGGRSPFGDTGSGYVADLKSGSNFILETANASNGFFSGKNFGNVTVRNNATISLNENFIGIENLNIENGSTFLLNASGPSPISGNIVNNGTLGTSGSGSSNLMMLGTNPQSISGGGAFNLGALSVASDANVSLKSSVSLAGTLISYIYGKLDLEGNQIVGNGVAPNTGRVQFRSPVNTATTAATIVNGSNVITFTNVSDYDALTVAPGMLITGPQIPANTYAIGTSSSGSITLSKPAIGDGNIIAVVGNTPVLSVANSAGIDGGFNINSNGSLTISTGTNVIFNAATTAPFSTISGNTLGDVTFNTAATTNKSITINGKLTLTNGKLTVNETDVVTIEPTGTFNGTFDNISYIATRANSTTGTVGTLKVNGLTSSTLIPVGTETHYTPITLAPTASSSFDVNVFAGATADGTANGTPLTAAQKLKMVDAVWNINRTSGSGNVDVTLGWDNALKGADFVSFTNAQIGIAGYNGTAYNTFAGSGNAAANTATLTTSSFSPFIVGEANTTLPLTLISFPAKETLNSVKLAWQTTDEVNLKNYVLQHRTAKGFEDIYTVPANNKLGVFYYEYSHLNPNAGTNYYRLVGVDLDGTIHISDPKSVNVTLSNAVAIYPNPVTKNTVSVSGVVNGDVIKITNIQGQVIATQKANDNQVLVINVQNIQAGTYILSVENAGKITSTKKVIKI